MPGTMAPVIVHQFLTNAGAPAVGYKLFTYYAGTTTKLTTYQDRDLSSSNTNPIILDSAGRATIYLQAQTYKFVLALPTDTDPPVSPIWTRDYVDSVPLASANVDILAEVGETVSAFQAVYLSDGSGSLQAGFFYKTTTANAYSSRGAYTLGIALSDMTGGLNPVLGYVRILGLVEDYPSTLSTGSPYYLDSTAGALTASASDASRIIGQARSPSSLLLSQWPLPPPATSTLSGLLTVSAQAITGVKTFASMPLVTEGTASPVQAPLEVVMLADGAAYKQATPAVGGLTGWSVAIPAGVLKKNGDKFRVTVQASANGTANTQTELRLVVGSSTISWRYSDNATKISGPFTVEIQRRTATTGIMSANGISLALGSCTPYAALTETWANALAIYTAHGTGATSTEYMQQEGILITYQPAP